MNGKILITGATGTVGRTLVHQLLESGAPVVAGVRDETAAASKLSGAPLVRFDFSDPSTFAPATEGVDRVFLLGPPMRTDLEALLLPFIDHLQAAGIRRVVYFGALGMEALGDMPFHTHLVRRLEEGGFLLTVLKPSFFAQNFRNYEGDNILQRGMVFQPAGSGRAGFVDVADVAAVAARVLTEEGHAGKSYELTGPEALSYSDAADLLTEITGRPVVYPDPSPEAYAGALAAAGAPPFIAPYMISVYGMIRDGQADRVSKDVERLTGRRPASLREVLQRDFAAADRPAGSIDLPGLK